MYTVFYILECEFCNAFPPLLGSSDEEVMDTPPSCFVVSSWESKIFNVSLTTRVTFSCGPSITGYELGIPLAINDSTNKGTFEPRHGLEYFSAVPEVKECSHISSPGV